MINAQESICQECGKKLHFKINNKNGSDGAARISKRFCSINCRQKKYYKTRGRSLRGIEMTRLEARRKHILEK